MYLYTKKLNDEGILRRIPVLILEKNTSKSILVENRKLKPKRNISRLLTVIYDKMTCTDFLGTKWWRTHGTRNNFYSWLHVFLCVRELMYELRYCSTYILNLVPDWALYTSSPTLHKSEFTKTLTLHLL